MKCGGQIASSDQSFLLALTQWDIPLLFTLSGVVQITGRLGSSVGINLGPNRWLSNYLSTMENLISAPGAFINAIIVIHLMIAFVDAYNMKWGMNGIWRRVSPF